MIRGKNSDFIPSDLIIEILSRLPAESIARFRCVSKLWGSILHRPYFTELFLTRSRARPRLFFALQRASEWSFYSSPQTQNSGHGLVHTRFHMKFSKDMWPHFRCLTSGLIYFSHMRTSRKDDDDTVSVICNPNTRQYAILPKQSSYINSISFLGFDPVEKIFKVFFLDYPCSAGDHQILTLGTGKLGWRTIQCPLAHYPMYEGICINGVLYYSARKLLRSCYVYAIVCFDVRYETFKFNKAERFYDQLINYKGKFGGVRLKDAKAGGIELSIWVLEDAEKPEWSKYVYTLPDENKVLNIASTLSVVGMTATSEIVLLNKKNASKPFYVFYFNPEKNSLQRVEIQGLGGYHEEFDKHRVYAYVDHVEDLNVNDAKTLKSAQA